MGKKKTERKHRLSEYTTAQLPAGSVIQFVYYEDFDNDGRKEAIIGISRFTPFPPDSAIILVKENEGSFNHSWMYFSDNAYAAFGIIDNAAVADTDGDGVPELVVSRLLSHEQDIDIHVFDWPDKETLKIWNSGRTFFHGSMELNDIDHDGISEILVESGTLTGEEIIALNESCYHVREGFSYKWDGEGYTSTANQVRMPYVSYNTAVDFLKAIWKRDYDSAYDMVILPGFLGLAGLDDSSPEAFRSYIVKNVMPHLMRNLSKGQLIPTEPFDTCCKFMGAEDCFTIELVCEKNRIQILSLIISKKSF